MVEEPTSVRRPEYPRSVTATQAMEERRPFQLEKQGEEVRVSRHSVCQSKAKRPGGAWQEAG